MTIKVRDAATSLNAKGFARAKERDHLYFFYWLEGKKTAVHAKISHGAKEIDDYVLGKIRKSLRLDTKRQAADLLQCPMTKADYRKFLIEHAKLRE
jgi:hypothetical protein